MRLVALIACGLAGCAHVGVTQMKAAKPKPEGCKLDIYSDEDEIEYDYEVVCLLDAKSGSTLGSDRSVSGAINEARPYACQCGGDGMLVDTARNEGVTLTTWGEGYAILKVIRYK
jgi:hypothetical protein